MKLKLFKKTRKGKNIVEDFDRQFHSDHAELNRILKEQGIKGRYR